MLLRLAFLYLFLRPISVEAQAQCDASYTIRTLEEYAAFTALGCTDVAGTLTIMQVEGLASLSGLETLQEAGGLLIADNPRLSSVDGLRNLERVRGDLEIVGNDALLSLGAWESLTEVGGRVFIEQNQGLTRIDGFESLRSVGQFIDMGGNLNVTEIDAFNRLETLAGGLDITYHSSLVRLGGFRQLETLGGYLQLHTNYQLSDCSCALSGVLSSAPPPAISLSNAPGCNTTEEIIEAYDPAVCGAVAAEPSHDQGDGALMAFPNPSAARLTLTFSTPIPTQSRLTIYDALGREVARPLDAVVVGDQEISLDTTRMPAGVYVARLAVAGRPPQTIRLSVVR